MIRRRILTAVGVVVITTSILVSAAFAGRAQAAQTAAVGAGNALKVSPVRMDLKMDPGTMQTVEVDIQNLTNAPAILHPAINDFVASGDESGKPNVILDENEYAPTHSFKRFASAPKDFTVAAGETHITKIVINVPKDAAGGGYFGAIRFSPANAEGDKNVNLAASVGTLVLLQVNGDIKEDLSIASMDVRKKDVPGTFFLDQKNLQVVVRFKNSGNVQVEPFGSIQLKRFGKLVTTYQINNGQVRSSALPDSIRRFTTSLDKVGPFGKYTLEGNFGYGTTGQLLTAKTTFYVIPLLYILIAAGVVLLLVFALVVVPRMIRAYNRKIIRRANRRR